MKKVTDDRKKLFWQVPMIALAIGIAPMPIGYYTLSRLIVSAGALYFCNHFYKSKDNTNLWIFGFIAVLYNPIIPVYLNEKLIWAIVNLITMYVFYSNKEKID